jgi:hypothetical protein
MAVVVATGHYTVPNCPAIWGIDEAVKVLPHKYEHSKSFRSNDDYVGKVSSTLIEMLPEDNKIGIQKVVIVGGSISAADLVADLVSILKGPLYLSQRGKDELHEGAFNLDGVVRKPPIRRITAELSSRTEAQSRISTRSSLGLDTG